MPVSQFYINQKFSRAHLALKKTASGPSLLKHYFSLFLIITISLLQDYYVITTPLLCHYYTIITHCYDLIKRVTGVLSAVVDRSSETGLGGELSFRPSILAASSPSLPWRLQRLACLQRVQKWTRTTKEVALLSTSTVDRVQCHGPLTVTESLSPARAEQVVARRLLDLA